MAADWQTAGGSETKRRKVGKKLLVNEKVEIRSVDDGFLGSWHPATVISCDDASRVVRYDNLVTDDGSGNLLVEAVKVNPALDGVTGKLPHHHRGMIRPLPPPYVEIPGNFHYGQCVDLFYNEAWWEGVIFDQNDGSEERKIFFPDMGDQVDGRIENLRVTLDWDEITHEWKPRGNWLFLEVIEEIAQTWPPSVSVKQIWYDVRESSGFDENLKEWTSDLRDIWKELVLRVVLDNLKLTVKHVFKEHSFYPLLNSSEPLLEDFLETDGLSCNSFEKVTSDSQVFEQNGQINLEPTSRVNTNEHTLSLSTNALPVIPLNILEDSGTCYNNYFDKQASSITRKERVWRQAVPDLVSGPEYFPCAVSEIIKFHYSQERPHPEAIQNCRKQLLYLGWKIEYLAKKKVQRVRYFSPEGELFDTLIKVCLAIKNVQDSRPEPQVPSIINPYSTGILTGSCKDMVSSPNFGNPRLSRASNLQNDPDLIVIEPVYCPEAVTDYLQSQVNKEPGRGVIQKKKPGRGSNNVLKVKQHLSAIGWSFFYQKKGESKREMRYASPHGKLFYTLTQACKWCVDCGELSPASYHGPTVGGRENVINYIGPNHPLSVNGSNFQPILPEGCKEEGPLVNVSNLPSPVSSSNLQLVYAGPNGNSPLVDVVIMSEEQLTYDNMSKGHKIPYKKVEVQKTVKKRGRKPKVVKVSRDIDGKASTHMLQTTSIAPEVVVSSHRARNILSWLIDNDVILPSAKLSYRKKDGLTLKEGIVTREGVKCNCCQKVHTLSGFEKHAGSTYHRPSANIFLEDGRSLAECQFQLNGSKTFKRSKLVSKEIPVIDPNRTNDYMCSICHNGGELLLCDQCPSAYHAHCLGLEKVPDGDWFCPPCCCGICGQSGLDRNSENFTDLSALVCEQCEDQYHVGCLKNKGMINLDSYPKGFWFCQDSCKRIFYDLRKILGKPISLETGNLTWTLVKHIKSDAYDRKSYDSDFLMENHSKLNLALSVMHECFEPVKDPCTGRDLSEDVIFSRRSELNRLNFRGFYTILLEQDDDLVTVATVRICGRRVAEMPLIGTRFQYRRLGMCRILMNQLEKKLKELGVETLVLPAIPSVLDTWTTQFGFSIMDESERVKFMRYTFLGFFSTVLCQKVLIPSTMPTKGICEEIVNIESDEKSAVSEVFQAERVEEETGVIDQRSIVMNFQPSQLNSLHIKNSTLPDHFAGNGDDKQVESVRIPPVLKIYKRRKIG